MTEKAGNIGIPLNPYNSAEFYGTALNLTVISTPTLNLSQTLPSSNQS